jgi:hypothetical protein
MRVDIQTHEQQTKHLRVTGELYVTVYLSQRKLQYLNSTEVPNLNFEWAMKFELHSGAL